VLFHTGIPSTSASFARTMFGQNVLCSGLQMSTTINSNPFTTQAALPVPLSSTSVSCHGKPPPIDSFTGEDAEIQFDDWLPTLERAAAWNNWTESETVCSLLDIYMVELYKSGI